MVRKLAALPAEVERARLLALQSVYDAIQAAGTRARLFYAGGMLNAGDQSSIDFTLALLAELRNQAITLNALAPAVEQPPDALSTALSNMYLSMFTPQPAKEDGV